MAREGLRLVVAEALERGAEEGRVEAAERARHAPVRRTRVEGPVPAVTAADWQAWRAARMACALAELDVYGFGEEEDDVHVA